MQIPILVGMLSTLLSADRVISAEELAQKYFEDYVVTGVRCTGEAVAK